MRWRGGDIRQITRSGPSGRPLDVSDWSVRWKRAGLTVHGRGEDDFADLWLGLMALLRSDWFPDCAAKCVWYDDDGTSEDVLAQAWKLKT